jgi:hypothetical protein
MAFTWRNEQPNVHHYYQTNVEPVALVGEVVVGATGDCTASVIRAGRKQMLTASGGLDAAKALIESACGNADVVRRS